MLVLQLHAALTVSDNLFNVICAKNLYIQKIFYPKLMKSFLFSRESNYPVLDYSANLFRKDPFL